MRIRFGRRAVLFSLISVLFSVLFITIFSQQFTSTYEDRIPGSNIRIKVMDVYTRNFETYIDDSVKVSAYRALGGITENLLSGGFSDRAGFERAFSGCMECDHTNCSNQNVSNLCGLGGYSLKARLDNITDLSSQQLNINTTYNINSISIDQEYPFEVQVTVNISYNVTDNSGKDYYARWSKNKVIVSDISIIGLYEPLGYYPAGFRQDITRYAGSCDGNESCWNINTVNDFYSQDDFRYYKGAPSYLQRFWDDLTPSDCCGIETILHPSAYVNDTSKSFIEHQYWSGTVSCAKGDKMVNLTLGAESISLDEATASRYGVSNSSIEYNCP